MLKKEKDYEILDTHFVLVYQLECVKKYCVCVRINVHSALCSLSDLFLQSMIQLFLQLLLFL